MATKSIPLMLSDKETVQVSTCIYITREKNNHTNRINNITCQPSYNTSILWRKISGLNGNPEPGYHFSPGWSCYIPLALCYSGVKTALGSADLYCGIEDRLVEVFKTHPLNESYRI